jgi:hypothetical protein
VSCLKGSRSFESSSLVLVLEEMNIFLFQPIDIFLEEVFGILFRVTEW